MNTCTSRRNASAPSPSEAANRSKHATHVTHNTCIQYIHVVSKAEGASKHPANLQRKANGIQNSAPTCSARRTGANTTKPTARSFAQRKYRALTRYQHCSINTYTRHQKRDAPTYNRIPRKYIKHIQYPVHASNQSNARPTLPFLTSPSRSGRSLWKEGCMYAPASGPFITFR